jgi:GH24 family phage-related lysozyme (muramidase)
MKTTQTGIELIFFFEGLKLKPYLCAVGIPTIGYGNTYIEDIVIDFLGLTKA